jgi:hypothetical protein
MTVVAKWLGNGEVLLLYPDGRTNIAVNPKQLWDLTRAARGCSQAWTTPQAAASMTNWIAERAELSTRARNHEAIDLKDQIAAFEREHGVTRVPARSAAQALVVNKPRAEPKPKARIDVSSVLAALNGDFQKEMENEQA